MLRPNPPESIRIGPFDFKLISWSHRESVSTQRYGECNTVAQEIRVDFDLNPQNVVDTVFHEIIHAFYFVYVIKDGDAEERIAQIMASALISLWRDNPQLMVWIDSMLFPSSPEPEYIREE